MKKALLLLFSAAALTACAPRHTLTGRIEGLTNDTLIVQSCAIEDMPLLASDSDERIAYDTIISAKGKLVYDIAVERPTAITIKPLQTGMRIPGGSRRFGSVSDIHLFLDRAEHTRIRAAVDSIYVNYSLSGSELNAAWSRYRKELLPLQIQATRLLLRLDRVEPGPKEDSIMLQYRGLQQKIAETATAFIRSNPDRLLSGYLFTAVPADSTAHYRERLGEKVRHSAFGPLIDHVVQRTGASRMRREAKARIKAGAEAPDFTLERAGGGTFTLSSLRGKYVVLDFWGSWCGWCIKGFPEMKKVYARHKGSLEIVGIACNDTPEKWLAAISEHALPWINVLNPAGARPTEDIAVGYAVDGFPTKIIIDPEGRFVDSYTGEVPAFYEKLAELLK